MSSVKIDGRPIQINSIALPGEAHHVAARHFVGDTEKFFAGRRLRNEGTDVIPNHVVGDFFNQRSGLVRQVRIRYSGITQYAQFPMIDLDIHQFFLASHDAIVPRLLLGRRLRLRGDGRLGDSA